MWMNFDEMSLIRSLRTVFLAFACASDEMGVNRSLFAGNSQIGYYCDAASIRGSKKLSQFIHLVEELTGKIAT